ncbi:hypothetical protein SULI_05840 [Saccharolobus solfataricus]|uniref:Uncharacterized protein n=3 Tax=Saccharolobus solfataricus TaxID=2287 RepID=Q980V8_SACS2|nr:hypothetical protein [Saccharolobus solfataricus]AAK40514.1 Hypothetical protein SSO0169 [Saccharolobus solfataricus P2]AKA73495.1 hypothetical protein SULB_1184 [Saccharolobus solfataricus]AKA76193.1 hypothetical protein SULC_1182 [Saccharolobus solfataricus]AKA78885.1 hypothetical protein SULA_1183 [Saccharolobus solfataricus]AZF67962.1 hypothetical protein SULG_05840 [Saccharolobus solfataricus]
MNDKSSSQISIRRAVIYAAVFSIASYAVAAGLALSTGLFAVNIFADPILNLTVPLILLSIGIQVINRKLGPIFIGLISAGLYAVSFLPFIAIPLIIIALIVEGVTRVMGYRSLKAVITYTAIAGGLEGVLSTLLALYMVKVPAPVITSAYIWTGVAVGMFAESALMGLISFYIVSYLIRAGVIK